MGLKPIRAAVLGVIISAVLAAGCILAACGEGGQSPAVEEAHPLWGTITADYQILQPEGKGDGVTLKVTLHVTAGIKIDPGFYNPNEHHWTVKSENLTEAPPLQEDGPGYPHGLAAGFFDYPVTMHVTRDFISGRIIALVDDVLQSDVQYQILVTAAK